MEDKKRLRKEYEEASNLSKEEWEKKMLENNSYYDIDMLQNKNSVLVNKIQYWENYKASGNFGKWWASLQIDKLKKKLQNYERKGRSGLDQM